MRNIILSILLFPVLTFSQGIDNLWMMGYTGAGGGTNIQFSSGVPVIAHVTRPMNFLTTSATICDTNGNTLFYSNGLFIANSTDDTMMNGSGLNPSNYTSTSGWNGLFLPQAVLILPSPGNSSIYYVIHSTLDDEPIGACYYMYYSVVDMTLDNGLGAVTSKNNILLNDTLIYGRITATKDGNGRDWWIVFHQRYTNLYYIYLLDPTGIHLYSSQHIGPNLEAYTGQSCFSPDGSKFAIYNSVNDLDLMDFDRCSGQFSNPIHVSINDNAAGGGVAFSPNSQVLYVSSTSYVYQFNLVAANIPSSQTTVAIWDTFYSPGPPAATTFYLSQLAPDGKIYISCTNGTLDIHVIDDPDSLGLACGVCQHCVHLPTYDGCTIPNHPNYHLAVWQGSLCDTLTSGIRELGSIDGEINIFPNPANRILYATLNSQRFKDIEIRNMVGQSFSIPFSFLKGGEYLELNISQLPSGVYFLELLSDKEKVIRRFVKE